MYVAHLARYVKSKKAGIKKTKEPSVIIHLTNITKKRLAGPKLNQQKQTRFAWQVENTSTEMN